METFNEHANLKELLSNWGSAIMEDLSFYSTLTVRVVLLESDDSIKIMHFLVDACLNFFQICLKLIKRVLE